MTKEKKKKSTPTMHPWSTALALTVTMNAVAQVYIEEETDTGKRTPHLVSWFAVPLAFIAYQTSTSWALKKNATVCQLSERHASSGRTSVSLC